MFIFVWTLGGAAWGEAGAAISTNKTEKKNPKMESCGLNLPIFAFREGNTLKSIQALCSGNQRDKTSVPLSSRRGGGGGEVADGKSDQLIEQGEGGEGGAGRCQTLPYVVVLTLEPRRLTDSQTQSPAGRRRGALVSPRPVPSRPSAVCGGVSRTLSPSNH